MSSGRGATEWLRSSWFRGGVRAIGWGAFVAAAAYFAQQAWVGASTFELGDETEKLVAALMIGEGERLYRDVFAHHGPLNYLLPHAFLSAFGRGALPLARLPHAALLVVAATAIWRSPLLAARSQRVLAVSALLGAIAPLWVLQGLHFGVYQNVGGILLVVPLAQLVLPAIVGAAITRPGALASGAAVALTAFSAYSFGPALALLAIAALVALLSRDEGRRQVRAVIRWATAGGLASALVVIAWLLAFGDLRGFLVYHLYFNQVIYASFIGFDWKDVLENLRWSMAPEGAVHTVAMAALVATGVTAGAVALAERESGRLSRALALSAWFAGALMLNPRGSTGFQANALVAAALAGLTLLLGRVAGAGPVTVRFALSAAASVVLVATCEITSRFALSTPHGPKRASLATERVSKGRDDSLLLQLVREMADPDERILALVFVPAFYLHAQRLPASAHFYYLPWQAAYERSPVEGYRVDLCRDLRERSPAVVFHDRWKVWDEYSPDEYAPCIGEILAERYVPLMMDPRLHVRRDRFFERWRPIRALIPATQRDRDALPGQVDGLRSVSIQLGESGDACLSLPARAAPAPAVAVGPCEGEDAKWYAVDEVPGAVMLVKPSSGLCADGAAGAMDPGARVVARRCAGTPNQLLRVEPLGTSVNLRFSHSSLCLAPGAVGEVLEQRPCPKGRGLWTILPRRTL